MLDDSFRLLFTYRWEIPRQAAFLPRSQFRRGTCFVCGSEGHWRNNYPNLISSGRSDKSARWCLWFWKVFRFFCLKLAPSGITLVFWSNSIRASDFIINTIVEGYRIPFFELPDNFVIPNRSSAFKFKDFVNEVISELLERCCVKEVLNPPKFINPLHVVQQSSGKCRLILVLSHLNRFIDWYAS